MMLFTKVLQGWHKGELTSDQWWNYFQGMLIAALQGIRSKFDIEIQ